MSPPQPGEANSTCTTTIDFLRARLLSERSVSRAAKDRAHHLARRIAEVEEQLQTISSGRRKAEQATAQVLAILTQHGCSINTPLDSSDSSTESDNSKKAEDAHSGSELPSSPPPGSRLPWKSHSSSSGSMSRSRAAMAASRARHIRSYSASFYYSSSSPSPQYKLGKSCRRNRRSFVASDNPEDGGVSHGSTGIVSHNKPMDSQKDTVEKDDLGSFSMECHKGEIERAIERQAKLIGQYQEEENAQEEWEKQLNRNMTSNVDPFASAHESNEAKNSTGQSADPTDHSVFGSSLHERYDLGTIFNAKHPTASYQLNPSAASEPAINEPGISHGIPQAGSCFFDVVPDLCVLGKNNIANPSYSLTNDSVTGHGSVGSCPVIIGPPVSQMPERNESLIEVCPAQQLSQTSDDNVRGILDGLRRAKLLLKDQLRSQDQPSMSSEILALPAPETPHRGTNFPIGDKLVPATPMGLFRLPTCPNSLMLANEGCCSGSSSELFRNEWMLESNNLDFMSEIPQSSHLPGFPFSCIVGTQPSVLSSSLALMGEYSLEGSSDRHHDLWTRISY